jgi:hypothetical protein
MRGAPGRDCFVGDDLGAEHVQGGVPIQLKRSRYRSSLLARLADEGVGSTWGPFPEHGTRAYSGDAIAGFLRHSGTVVYNDNTHTHGGDPL